MPKPTMTVAVPKGLLPKIPKPPEGLFKIEKRVPRPMPPPIPKPVVRPATESAAEIDALDELFDFTEEDADEGPAA